MPHVIVKMHAGRSEEQKKRIAEGITKVVMEGANCPETVVSVAIEDFAPADWAEAVYRPDIAEKPEGLYKKPGYNPL